MTICSSNEIIDEFELLTRDAGHVQQDTLRKILELNADSEYLNRFNLERRTDSKSFKSCIPLCVHSDIESYIQRIADGDNSLVLTGKPITSLSVRYQLKFYFCLMLHQLVSEIGELKTSLLLSSLFQFWYNTGKTQVVAIQ